MVTAERHDTETRSSEAGTGNGIASPTDIIVEKQPLRTYSRSEEPETPKSTKDADAIIHYVTPTTSNSHSKRPGSAHKFRKSLWQVGNSPTSSPSKITSMWTITDSPIASKSNIVLEKTSVRPNGENAVKQIPKKRKLLRDIAKYQKKIAHMHVSISRLRKYKLEMNKKMRSATNFHNVLFPENFKTKYAQMFVQMQLSHGRRQPWRKEEKDFAISLYFKSPSTYRFLLERMVLPAIPTVRHWIGGSSKFMPGLSKVFFRHLKLKASTMTEMSRECVILFDEMSIKSHLEYSSTLDVIEGYEDMGHIGRTKKLGKYAGVFLLRGLFHHWKLPIGYFISEHGLSGVKIKELLQAMILQLVSIDLEPRAFVCDQASTNRKAMSELGVSPEKPFFKVGERKIFCLYDVPHLIKSLRNNFLQSDFILENETLSFENVRQVYKIDSSSSSTRALWKLSPAHIWPNSFQKMVVRLATQVLSFSVAAAIRSGVALGKLKLVSALPTANFINFVNDLFDALNSKTPCSDNPNKRCLSEDNPNIFQILRKGINTFNNIKKKNGTRPPCFDGFLLTLNAILSLYSSLNCKYILTARLNQDVLENFFSSIRQRGGFNRNPTVKGFRTSYRVLAVKNIVQPPKTSSYEGDDDVLLPLEDVATSTNSTLPSGNEEPEEEEEEKISDSSIDFDQVGEVSERALTLEDCSTAYFAGYLLKRLKDRIDCENCKNIFGGQKNIKDRSQILIIEKTFPGIKKDTEGLVCPSKRFVRICKKALLIFKNQFRKKSHQRKLRQSMLRKAEEMLKLEMEREPQDCYEHLTFTMNLLFECMIKKSCKWLSPVASQGRQKIKILSNL
jgi:hypothetical protein